MYYRADAQTSIRCLTNDTGSVVERYLYTAYGVPTIFNGTGTKISATAYDNRFLYTAREWDHKTYQYDFRARWYSPGLGRFTSRDPLHYVDGPSLYRGYFNPGNVDPSGNLEINVRRVDDTLSNVGCDKNNKHAKIIWHFSLSEAALAMVS